MKKIIAIGACLGLSWAAAEPAGAFNENAVNLGSTSFLDGGPVKPGTYLVEYGVLVNGFRARDKDGNQIPGGAAIAVSGLTTQVVHVTPWKILGANFGLDAVLPIVTPSAKGSLGPVPVTANTGGLGDLIVGPLLQWNETTLFGRPFMQRIESDVCMPTGKYDPNFAVNPGVNFWTVDSYYAFSWFFAHGWETSWRFWYAFNGENGATHVKAGQLAHVNFAMSREVLPQLRLGVSGYALRQTTDDKLDGARVPDSRERAFALGPGLVYQNPAFLLVLSNPIEFGVQNRFAGTRTVLQLIHKF
jgi:hypothetical protein